MLQVELSHIIELNSCTFFPRNKVPKKSCEIETHESIPFAPGRRSRCMVLLRNRIDLSDSIEIETRRLILSPRASAAYFACPRTFSHGGCTYVENRTGHFERSEKSPSAFYIHCSIFILLYLYLFLYLFWLLTSGFWFVSLKCESMRFMSPAGGGFRGWTMNKEKIIYLLCPCSCVDIYSLHEFRSNDEPEKLLHPGIDVEMGIGMHQLKIFHVCNERKMFTIYPGYNLSVTRNETT